MFHTFRVGRSASADIVLSNKSLSRRQIEITVTDTNRYYVVDCASSAGTWIWDGEDWKPHSQGYIEPKTYIAFGGTEVTTLEKLIADLPNRKPETSPHVKVEPLSVRPRRKGATGEVHLE